LGLLHLRLSDDELPAVESECQDSAHREYGGDVAEHRGIAAVAGLFPGTITLASDPHPAAAEECSGVSDLISAIFLVFSVHGVLFYGPVGLIEVLTSMYNSCIIMHMRSTLNIDDDLIEKATKLTGITEKTSLVRMGLKALIAKESARRLAELGASEPKLEPIRRRRKIT